MLRKPVLVAARCAITETGFFYGHWVARMQKCSLLIEFVVRAFQAMKVLLERVAERPPEEWLQMMYLLRVQPSKRDSV